MAFKTPEPIVNELVDDIGSIIQYNPYVKNESGDWAFSETPIRARKLHNGMAMETKAYPKEHIYAGNKGKYKLVDTETGLMVGFASGYDDAIRISQDEELLAKIKRAKELRKKLAHE